MTSLLADKAQAALQAYKTGDIAPIQALIAESPRIVMHPDAGKLGYASAWFNVLANNNRTGVTENIDVYMPLAIGYDAVNGAQRTINAKMPSEYIVISAQMDLERPF